MSGERVKGKRGEEATQLSDFRSQTEKRHLRHTCKTTRKLDFILFALDYFLRLAPPEL